MASKQDLMELQKIIDYEFHNESLGITALTAADRSDEAGRSDGNRRLAQVGSRVLELMSCNISWTEDDDRAQANQKLCSRVNYHNLAGIAMSSGIYKLMKFSPRQEWPLPDKVLSKAVQAVAGAVWHDTGCNFLKVTQAIHQLHCYDTAYHQQSAIAEPNFKPAEQTIDPSLLTVNHAKTELTQNHCSIASVPSEVMNYDIDDLNSYKTNSFRNENQLGSSHPHDCTVDWNPYQNHRRADEMLATELSDPDTLPDPAQLHKPADVSEKNEFGIVLANPLDVTDSVSINQLSTSRKSINEKNSVSQSRQNPRSLQKFRKFQKDSTEGSERIEELRRIEAAKWSPFRYLSDDSAKYSHCIESLKRRALECQMPDGGNFLVRGFLMLTSSTSVLSLKEVLRSHRNGTEENLHDNSLRQSPTVRFNTIQSLSNNISRNILLRRYHILQLYIDCIDPYSAGIQEGFIVNTPGNTSIHKPSELGNALNLAKRRTTNAMMEKIFPQSTNTNRSKQERTVKLLQRLGESLFTLTSGGLRLGILALLPTEVSILDIEPSLNLSDASLMEASVAEIQMLVYHLEHSTNHFSQFIVTGNQVLEIILKMNNDKEKQFFFESAESEDIEARPADSLYLLHFLQQI